MKPFKSYQYLEGTEMTERDKKEVGSKFWNKGKWDNFVLPFLKEVSRDMVLTDMGCNAGLFLKLAEDLGFGKAVGIDGDKEAIEKGKIWRDKNGYHYTLIQGLLEEAVKDLPLADYTVLANTHYYLTIDKLLDYLDQLQYKTRFCIIVTAEGKFRGNAWSSTRIVDIRRYFKNWQEIGYIPFLPTEGDPMPRKLEAICFKSPFLERVPLESLIAPNLKQNSFYEELEKGIPYKETEYYKWIEEYRKDKWSERRINRWIEVRIAVYQDLKANWLKKPIITDSKRLVLDGNHRQGMMRSLGVKTILIRRI